MNKKSVARKIRYFLITCLVFGAINVASVQAAPAWYTISVNRAGPSLEPGKSESVFMKINYIGGPVNFGNNKWVQSVSGLESKVLTMALSGVALGLRMDVYMDLDITPYPLVYNMYVSSD